MLLISFGNILQPTKQLYLLTNVPSEIHKFDPKGRFSIKQSTVKHTIFEL